MDWARDGEGWPNREHSRFVTAAGLRWHVQVTGTGPTLLLLHGTGASTHSFRALLAPLAARFSVVLLDLPGHGFTGGADRRRVPDAALTLPGMARGVAAVLTGLDHRPAMVAGHSAGAAVAIQMALSDPNLSRVPIVGINAALLPFRGMAGHVFGPLARLAARNPLIPRLVAWRAADRRTVERLLWSTGSALDPAGIDLYARLLRDPDHVSATLRMMANWDLADLERRLPALSAPLTLLVGDNDRTVSPDDARGVARLLPATRIEILSGLGHLAHEQRPALVASRLLAVVEDQTTSSDAS